MFYVFYVCLRLISIFKVPSMFVSIIYLNMSKFNRWEAIIYETDFHNKQPQEIKVILKINAWKYGRELEHRRKYTDAVFDRYSCYYNSMSKFIYTGKACIGFIFVVVASITIFV